MNKEVLIQGSSPGALRAAEILADCGISVHLVDPGPFIGAGQSGERPAYVWNTQLLEILKNPRIQTWTNTRIKDHAPQGDTCQVNLIQSSRYVDLSRCTACGECVEICPVTIPGTSRKAIHLGGQPDCAVISKDGLAPCASACPAGIPVQGYVALIAEGRYQEAYQLIHDALPFPSVCGRVCNHACEAVCSRLKVDEAVNIMGLKRFVSDWMRKEGIPEPDSLSVTEQSLEEGFQETRIAVIGAGPAGLTAARDLVRAGYQVKVFDANSEPGGMMRVGIPPHRLPYDHLEWEIDQILAEGVELQLNTWVDDIPGLLAEGYAAVLLATGAHQALKVSLENADHPDNWLSLDFLKDVCLGKKINLTGRKVIVLGGGDVAMDAARSAIRLGKPAVTLLCRGLRASFNEIEEAEEEGVQIIRNRVFKRILLDKGKIAGVECLEAEVGDVVDGKRQFRELPGTEHVIPGDLIIWAIGQRPDFSFLPAEEQLIQHSTGGIEADARMMTHLEGVFTAGDVRRGTTFFVVDAVGEGHQAARSIINYLEGDSPTLTERQLRSVDLKEQEVKQRLMDSRAAQAKRAAIPRIPVSDRENSFIEVELTLGEKEARTEANRCLSCGPCSECLACLAVCEPGAIFHDQPEFASQVEVQGWIAPAGADSATGVEGLIPMEGDQPLAGAAAGFEALKANPDLMILDALPLSPLPAKQAGTGVVLCRCGGEISRYLDTSGLCQEIAGWPDISQAVEIQSACSPQGAEQIKAVMGDNQLGRWILAACSCCALDQVCYSCTYQRIRCKGNLDVYSDLPQWAEIQFVNIREGCAFLYPRSRKKATQAARQMIAGALSAFPMPLNQPDHSPDVQPLTLVVGKGKSAQVCCSALAEVGYPAEQVEVLSGPVLRVGGKFITPGPEKDLQADCLVLAPTSGAELDYISKSVQLTQQRPLLEGKQADDTRRLGVFTCLPALDPLISGRGAAGEVLAWTGKLRRNRQQPAAWVNPHYCRSCGTCVDVCGLGIPDLLSGEGENLAWINPSLCQDCGTCVARCPAGAIEPGVQTDLMLGEALKKVMR